MLGVNGILGNIISTAGEKDYDVGITSPVKSMELAWHYNLTLMYICYCMKSNEAMCPVLIVDDDNDLCKLLQLMVSRICPVHIEHTLKDAGSYLAATRPEISLPKIILLDNNLPDGAGVTYG